VAETKLEAVKLVVLERQVKVTLEELAVLQLLVEEAAEVVRLLLEQMVQVK
jgi:DNA-binding winged helix-turn-helix (wHTH) protein